MHFSRWWDIVEGHYWFYVNFHEGQGSRKYERLCRIQRYFRPGLFQRECSTEESQEVYKELCRRQLKGKSI